MEQKNQIQKEELTLKDIILMVFRLFKEVLKYWWFIILTVLIGSSFFLYKHYTHKVTYDSTISFMVEGNGGTSGGLSSLLGSFGIKKGGATNVHRILQVARSTKLISKVLFDSTDTKELLGNRIIEIYSKDKDWLELNPIFKTYRFDANEKLKRTNTGLALKTMKRLFWSQDNGDNFYDISLNSESGIFKLSTRTNLDSLSYLMNLSLYNNVKHFFESEVFQNQLEATKILQEKADSLKSLGTAKVYELAKFNDQNFGLINERDQVRKTVLMGEIQAINLAYSEIVKNYELTDFNLKDSQPLFIEIETPYLPLKRNGSFLLQRLLYGIAIGGFLGVVLIIARRLYLDIME